MTAAAAPCFEIVQSRSRRTRLIEVTSSFSQCSFVIIIIINKNIKIIIIINKNIKIITIITKNIKIIIITKNKKDDEGEDNFVEITV